MNEALDIVFLTIDIVIVAVCIVHALVALFIIGGLVLCYKDSQFNGLWISRWLITAFIFLWDLGIILGTHSVWKLILGYTPSMGDTPTSYIINAFCSAHSILVLAIGFVGTTSIILFILLHRFTATVHSKTDPTKSSDDATATEPWWNLSFRMPVCGANLKILWKAFFVLIFMCLFQGAVVVIYQAFGGLTIQFLFNLYDKTRGACTLPVISAGILDIYLIVFLIVYNIFGVRLYHRVLNRGLKGRITKMHILLTVFIIVGGICRALEVIFNIDYIANAMQWPYLVHIFRIMSFIMDLIQSTTLLIFYVIIPVRDTIGVRKWRATVDVARVDLLKSLKKTKSTREKSSKSIESTAHTPATSSFKSTNSATPLLAINNRPSAPTTAFATTPLTQSAPTSNYQSIDASELKLNLKETTTTDDNWD